MSKVLVVEDSPTQREFIACILMNHRFRVVTASNGLEALEAVQACRPDLVLLDIVMPEMNGYDVCRELKRHPLTCRIPVILCSTKRSEIDRYWGSKIGADAYIGKPFKQNELIGAIQHLLGTV